MTPPTPSTVTDQMCRVAAEAMKQRRRDEIEGREKDRATYEQMAMLALTAALDGMVIVPREPGREQLDAMAVECRATWGVNVKEPSPAPVYTSEWRERMKPIYRAMISAATPPAQGE